IGLSYLALVQIIAFVLNILPIPGLDGYRALEPYLPPEAREFGMKARPWAPLVLFPLIIAVPGVGNAFFEFTYPLSDAIGGNGQLGQLGFAAFQSWRRVA